MNESQCNTRAIGGGEGGVKLGSHSSLSGTPDKYRQPGCHTTKSSGRKDIEQ